MPKANPFAQIAKRVASLQSKSAKINDEILALVQIVAVEMKKQDAAPAPAKVAPVKASPKTVATKAAPAKSVKKVPAQKKKGKPAQK